MKRKTDPTSQDAPANTGGQQVSDRNGRGQFLPGTSGNPAGRPEGSRNRATLALQDALASDGERVLRKAVEMALAGNEVAIRLLLERMLPVAKERIISLDLPEVKELPDIAEAIRRVVDAAASGEITAADADSLLKLLNALRSALLTQRADRERDAIDRLIRFP
jgi:hypothetical protein